MTLTLTLNLLGDVQFPELGARIINTHFRILRWHSTSPQNLRFARVKLRLLSNYLGIQNGRSLNLVSPRTIQYVSGHVVRVRDNASHLSGRLTRKVRVRKILQMTHILCLVVHNVHLAHIVNPQLANYDVAHERGHFAPRVMVPGALELEV